jgi:hypothetical protein
MSASPSMVAAHAATKVQPGSIGERLSITSAALVEVLNLRAMRPSSKFVFVVREDDNLG